MSLHDDFEKEEDLGKSFEAEQSVEKPSMLQNIKSNMLGAAKSIGDAISSSSEAIAPYLQSLAESGIDTARGVGQGLTIGAGDEIGGALSALAERPASYLLDKINGVPSDLAGLPDSSNILDRYRESQKAIQKENEFSQERSPYLSLAGQLAGGVASGSAIGGALGIGGEAAANAPKLLDIARNEGKLKALGELGLRGLKTYKQALPTIALEGALSSKEGGLTSIPEAKELGKDVVGSALFGLPAVMGLQAVTEVGTPLAREAAGKIKSKVGSMVEDAPLLRQMKAAYGYGLEGINPKSQKTQLESTLGKTNLAELDNTRTQELMNEIQDAQQRVGQATRQSLVDATAAGKQIDIAPEVKDALSQVQSLADKYPEISNNPRAKEIFGKIASSEGSQVTPTDAKDLIDYMDAYIGKFKAATNKTPLEEGILSNLYQTRKQFSNTLQTQVPEYGAAAERYTNFMNLVPETILAKNKPVDIKDQMFSNLNKGDEKLFDSLKQMIQGTTRPGSATESVRESFVQSMKGLKTFEQQEAERLAAGTIKESALQRPASAIEDMIKKYSDDAVARNSMDALNPHTGVASTMAKVLTGTGETGRAMALSSANLAGRLRSPINAGAMKNPIAKMSRAIYNAPHETVTALANSLKNQAGLEKYGQNLEHALQSTDSNRRNQVLFTIMQNPSARAFVDQHANEDESNNVPQE